MASARFQDARDGWVVSPLFDLSVFILSMAAAVPFLTAARVWPQAEAAFLTLGLLLLGQAHFGSTWTAYLDRANLRHYRSQPVRYYVVPALLVVGSCLLGWFGELKLLSNVAFWFSGFHVMRQSVGILNLYRMRNRGSEPADRGVEELAVLSLSWACYLVPVALAPRSFLPGAWLPGLAERLPLTALGFGVAGVALARLAWHVLGKLRRQVPLSVPHLAFLLTSLLLYAPFAAVETIGLRAALLINLSGHYVQYVGLVWWLAARRYRAEPERATPLLLWMSRSALLTGIVLVAYAALYQVAESAPMWLGASPLGRALAAFAIATLLVHYYVDRYLWQFRNPHVRESLGRYLARPEPRAATAA